MVFWYIINNLKYFLILRNSPTSTQPKVSGPFGLDMDLLQRIELNAPVKYRNPVLLEVNLNDLNESPNALNPSKVP